MPGEVERISKRGDDGDPVTGTLTDAGGPADLRGYTLRFLAKAKVNNAEVIIDSSNADGECINVEDEDGSTIADRGKYRFEMTVAGVSTAGLFECEVEGTKGGKKVTWPGRAADNPGWQIDPDIA